MENFEMRNKPLPLGKVRFVIFDWDNTLADSRPALLFAIRQVLAEKGLPVWEEVCRNRNHDLSFKDNFPIFFGGRAEEIYARYAEVYLQHVKDLISTFDGVRQVLDFLAARRVKMMIMSNKDRRLLDYELPLLFDPAMFEKIVCGHEAEHDKPYPEHIFYALSGYLRPDEISPEEVWMVGDSPMDSNCAKAAHALPIRIGEDIWHTETEEPEKIRYFDDFVHFDAALSGKN